MSHTPLIGAAGQGDKFKWHGASLIRFLGVVTFGMFLWYMPPPEGLTPQAWHLFTIFVSTVVAIIAQPLPIGAIVILVAALCVVTHTLSLQQVLDSFSTHIVWLVFGAFLIARGFIKTGLGTRIAYLMISRIGRTTLGVSYGMIFTELLLAPLIPSNSARGAGIMFPLVSALNEEYESFPDSDHSRRKMGAYLIQVLYHTNTITSGMFLTAMAANPMMTSCALGMGIDISWGTWALAAFVPGLLSLIALPLAFMVLMPPSIRQTPHAPAAARQKLAQMGSLSFDEIVMLLTFGLLLVMWVFSPQLGIHPTTAAFIGLGVLLFTGVLTWDDVLKEQNAWNTFIWLSILLMLSGQLNEQGIIHWLSRHLSTLVSGMGWITTLSILSLFYYFSHYFFASMTAHVSSMFAALLLVALSAGAPPIPTVMLLGGFSSMSSGLTHYGTGTAPVFYGAGYVTLSEWWRNGFIISVINIVIWSTAGFLWWKIIGLW